MCVGICGNHLRAYAGPVPNRWPGEHRSSDHWLAQAEVREPVVQESECVRVACSLARGAQHDADQRHPALGPRSNQNVSGVERVAGLHPVDPRHVTDQVVAVDDEPDVVARVQHGGGSGHHSREERGRPEQVARQLDEIPRTRVVTRRVETDGGGIAGMRQAELACPHVHHRDEVRNRAAAEVVREVLRGVVRARQQQCEQ